MQIIKPIKVTINELTSSIPFNDATIWQEGKYNLDDEVIFDRWIYKALETTTDRPDIGASKKNPSWVLKGSTNRWKMFDDNTSSQSTSEGFIEVSVEHPQNINAIAALNLTCSKIRVLVFDNIDGLIYDSGLISLFNNNIVSSWYDYFFEPYDVRNDYVFLDLPANYPGARITIKLEGETEHELVGCGEIVLGAIKSIGTSNYGTSTGIIDYSRKEVNEFGDFFLLQRRFTKRVSYDISIESNLVGFIQKTLADLRTTPAVWIGSNNYDTTIVYGFYKDFDIVISTPSLSQCSISVEGL